MKTLCTLLVQDFRRSIFTFRFLFASLGITLCNFLSSYWDITSGAGDCVAYFYMLSGMMGIENLYLLLAVIPGALLFYMDEESQFIRSVILRSGKTQYLISKSITTFISAALTIIVGDLIFISSLSISYPLMGGDFLAQLQSQQFGVGYDQMYFVVKCSLKMLCGCAFAMLTLKISVNVQNIYVVLFSPLIIYFTWSRFSVSFGIPAWLNADRIVEGFAVGKSWTEGYIFGVCFFLICSVICGIWFVCTAEGRIQNE